MMNQYPAKPMMDQMAQYGRYGDSMLVHMNPAEVAGIASLVPGGRLTTNPVTGQPEAFLPLLLGFAAKGLGLSALGTGALVGAGTAAVTGDLKRGILSGLTAGFGAGAADAAGLGETIQSGTEVASSAFEGATGIVPDATAISELAGTTDVAGSSLGALGEGIEQARAAVPDALKMQPEFLDTAVDKLGFTGNLMGAGITGGMEEQMKMEERFANQARARQAEGEADRREAFDDLQRGYAMAQPGAPTGLSDARSEMSRRTPPPMYMNAQEAMRSIQQPITGSSINAQQAIQSLYTGMSEGGSTNKKEDEASARREDDNPYAQRGSAFGGYRDVARFIGGPRGYFGIDPVTVQQRLRGPDVVAPPRDYMPGFEPEFDYFQDASEGISIPDRGYRPMKQGVISRGQYFDPVLQAPQSNAQMNEYRRTLEKMDPGPLDIGTVMGLASEGSVLSPMQQNVLESYYATPAPTPETTTEDTTTQDTTTNTGIELNDTIRSYFPNMTDQEIRDQLASYQSGNVFNLASNITDPNVADVLALSTQAGVGPNDVSPLSSPETLMAMYPNLTEAQARAIADLSINPIPFQEGGQTPDVMLQTSLGSTSVPGGGIAQVPTEFTAKNQMPSMDEVQMLSMAVLGQVENGDRIVEMFVQKYGPEVFGQVREMILQSVVPNAQTEGMIRGNGSGMDDAVQGMIGSDQPVAVSPGEFIVPADVVSGLGEGSSDAGAEKLDEMMNKVRMERNGTTRQAPPIDERKVMPA